MVLPEARLPISVVLVTHDKNTVLAATLRSFLQGGLCEIVDRVEVYDSGGQASTEGVCAGLGFSYTSSAILHSLAAAQNEAVQECKSEYVILLEDDSYLLSSPQNTYDVLRDSVKVLQVVCAVETVRLRHRERPGYPLHPMWFAGQEDAQDERKAPHLLGCVHWYKNPSSRVPELAELTLDGILGNWYTAPHRHACYTNNPCLYRREWWMQNIMPKNEGAAARNEDNLEGPWKAMRPFLVAHGPGLFTHWDFEKHSDSTLGTHAFLSPQRPIEDYLCP